MIKFFYGEESYLVNLALKKEKKLMKDQPIFFDENDSYERIVMEIQTVSMFFSKKNIIVKNHPIISNSNLAKKFIEDCEKFLNDLNIIFVSEDKRINQNSLIKFIKKEGFIKEFKNILEKDSISIIKDIVENFGGKITTSAATRLSSKLPLNLWIIVNEIKKLLLENLDINDEMVIESIGDYFEDDYFSLTNAIVSFDKRSIIASYQDKLKINIKPAYIINQISQTLIQSKRVSSLRNIGLSNKEISSKLRIHEYRIKKSLDLVNSRGEKSINKLIKDLSKLDKDIKTGKVDENIGLDNYILQIIK